MGLKRRFCLLMLDRDLRSLVMGSYQLIYVRLLLAFSLRNLLLHFFKDRWIIQMRCLVSIS